MHWFQTFYWSSIGSKVVMAVTGLLLLGFVLGHLAGNLLVFVGQSAINDYAQWLVQRPALIWTARIGLLLVFGLHIITGVRLSRRNSLVRPQKYAFMQTVQASLASRYMLQSGLVVLLYVIYHLLHLTLGVTDAEAFKQTESLLQGGQMVERHDVYSMLVVGFSDNMVVAVYVLANLVLAWHLSHGISSTMQSLGIRDGRYTPLIEKAGVILAAFIGAGFISIPLCIRLGLVPAS